MTEALRIDPAAGINASAAIAEFKRNLTAVVAQCMARKLAALRRQAEASQVPTVLVHATECAAP